MDQFLRRGYYFNVSGITIVVKQIIYNLLGVLAEIYPEKMVNYSERLIDLFMRTLKQEVQHSIISFDGVLKRTEFLK